MLDNFFMTQFAEKITPLTLLRNKVYSIRVYLKHVDKEKAGGIIKSGNDRTAISKASIDENSGKAYTFGKKDGDMYIREVKTKLELSVETLLCLCIQWELYSAGSGKSSLNGCRIFCPTSDNTLRIHMYRSVKKTINLD